MAFGSLHGFLCVWKPHGITSSGCLRQINRVVRHSDLKVSRASPSPPLPPCPSTLLLCGLAARTPAVAPAAGARACRRRRLPHVHLYRSRGSVSSSGLLGAPRVCASLSCLLDCVSRWPARASACPHRCVAPLCFRASLHSSLSLSLTPSRSLSLSCRCRARTCACAPWLPSTAVVGGRCAVPQRTRRPTSLHPVCLCACVWLRACGFVCAGVRFLFFVSRLAHVHVG
jgi:hypothetical protein